MEGNWSEWQACDRGWVVCGLKTKVAPSLGVTGISLKCCPASKKKLLTRDRHFENSLDLKTR
jgi:hypothetical protein